MEIHKDEREVPMDFACPICRTPQPGCEKAREGMLVNCPQCRSLLVLVHDEDTDGIEFQVTVGEM